MYNFAGTADGSEPSLKMSSGGHCSTHHMRLRIYVCGYNGKKGSVSYLARINDEIVREMFEYAMYLT